MKYFLIIFRNLIWIGLSGLFPMTLNLVMFTGFRVGFSDLVVSLLQNVDDTLILAEASMDNIWLIKSILKSFVLDLDLCVNFAKSCLISVNGESGFLELASDFHHSRLSNLLNNHLDLPMGAKTLSKSSW